MMSREDVIKPHSWRCQWCLVQTPFSVNRENPNDDYSMLQAETLTIRLRIFLLIILIYLKEILIYQQFQSHPSEVSIESHLPFLHSGQDGFHNLVQFSIWLQTEYRFIYCYCVRSLEFLWKLSFLFYFFIFAIPFLAIVYVTLRHSQGSQPVLQRLNLS